MVFHLRDGNMGEYILSQPQVFVGDTIIQGTPDFLKSYGSFMLATAAIGILLYWANPMPVDYPVNAQIQQIHSRHSQYVQNRQFVKWANQNNIGLKVSHDSFPRQNLDCLNVVAEQVGALNQQRQQWKDVNGEIGKYLAGLRGKARDIVEKRKQEHHNEAHGHSEHSNGHSEHSNEHSNEHSSEHVSQHVSEQQQHHEESAH